MNKRGALTIDYMFSFMLVSGFALVIITLSSTLSTVELIQYITFASARNYYAGNISEAAQKEAAAQKFFELRDNPAAAALLSGGWFELNTEDMIIDYNIPEKYPQFKPYSSPEALFSGGYHLFHGTVVFFTAKILEFQIPFFGSTRTDRADSNSGFGTHIGSYLGRETSFDECHQFNQQRWLSIKNLPVSGGAPYSQAGGDNAYVTINDNGC